MNKRSLAHFALLFTNLFFAINISAVKHLTNLQLALPFGINVVRVGVSVILFWFLYLLKPVNIHIDREDRKRLFFCAVTGIAINQLLFLKGLSLTYPIHASLLMLTTPILIVFIAAWILKERVGWMKIAGLALGVAGATVLILGRSASGNGNEVIWGDVMILINAISYTIYFILVKPLMLKYDPIVVIRWIFSIGLFLILPFGWVQFTEIQWPLFTGMDYLIMTLVVFTGTFLAYVFNVYGIKYLGASVAGFYIYTQPVFAAIIAMIFLKETLTMYKLVAAALIFSGVFLANKTVKNA
ncbi:MAG: DMT family transporter [Sphingobacteriales bacterium]|nr:DMT family transporter [Sphingobacteriales bacterium]